MSSPLRKSGWTSPNLISQGMLFSGIPPPSVSIPDDPQASDKRTLQDGYLLPLSTPRARTAPLQILHGEEGRV